MSLLRFNFILAVFIFVNLDSLAQKPKSVPSKKLSPEEQWIRDSLQFERESQEQFRKDSLKWEKTYNNRFFPKDSLSYLDVKASKIFKKNPFNDLDSLAKCINQNFSIPLHRARAIYFWIGTNVKYDSVSYLMNSVKYYNNINKDAQATFQLRKGVCAHYAALFQYLSEKCGLETVTISGYTKNYPFMEVSSKSDHAWNAVKIKNKWILVDATWGRKDDSEIETFWFGTDPSKFIYSHFPEDSSYQLLKKKLTQEEFRVKPIISSLFFLSQIPIKIPELGFFSSNDGQLKLLGANTKRNYDFRFWAFPVISNFNNEFTRNEEWISIPYNVKPASQKGFSIIETTTPGKGTWWIKIDIIENIFTGKEKMELIFPRAMIFQITNP